MPKALLDANITPIDKSCPFTNKAVQIRIEAGQCFWLQGQSGAGKTTVIRQLSGLADIPGAKTEIHWGKDIAPKERVGVLFQQGVLIDTLSVYENIALSCHLSEESYDRQRLNAYLAAVKLRPEDGQKMAGQLSGGMLRRAALAQILAQKKRVIILDEPFVGLDESTAQEIVETLVELRDHGQAFILISHDKDYAKLLATPSCEAFLTAQTRSVNLPKLKQSRWYFSRRLMSRFCDYLLVSMPLIVCAFIATGLAISTLFCQLLYDVDLQKLLDTFSHNQDLTWTQHVILHVVQSQLDNINTNYMPLIRAKLYALVLGQTFLTQLGPMLTALLLVGRIGGSYTGEIAMMQATQQNALLFTLGTSPRRWTLLPACIAALVATPILTLMGSAVAIYMGGLISVHGTNPIYHSMGHFWQSIQPQLFPTNLSFFKQPLAIACYRSLGFMLIILLVSELCGRYKANLQPREVPKTITWAIVIASLLILMADWGFTALLPS